MSASVVSGGGGGGGKERGEKDKDKDPTDPLNGVKDALRALNQLDNLLLVNYEEGNTPAVTAAVNDLVGSLKRVQENRHKVHGDIPFELLDRMDREDLSPHVFTIESLERAVTEVRALAQRDAMLRELRRGVEEGLAGGGGGGGAGEEVVGMDVDAGDGGDRQGMGRS